MKKFFSSVVQPSLRLRLFTFFSVVVALFSVFLFFYLSQQFEKQILLSEQAKVISVTELSAASVALPLQRDDTTGIDVIFKSLQKQNTIVYIIILDDNKKLVAGVNVDSAVMHHYLEVKGRNIVDRDHALIKTNAPIRIGENSFGSIHIGFSLHTALSNLDDQRRELAWISVIRLLIGTILVFILTTIVLRPINTMMNRFMHAVQSDIFHHMHPTGYEEIDRFVRSFNTIVDELAAAQTELHSVNRTLEHRVHERTRDLQNEIQNNKVIEDALRESEERYRALVELSPDAIIVFSDEKFHFINPAALSMFGVEAKGKNIEQSLFEFMTAYRKKQFQEMINQVITGTETNVQSEFIFNRLDGSEFVADITATRLFYERKNSIQIVIRDISERFKNERKRLDLEQQLLHIQKKEIIGTLASGIAHDILNILGIIGTAINKLLFLKNIDQKSLMESAEQISKATDRGKALVKQLLTFAKKTELNFGISQVNTPVSEIINVVQRTFPGSIIVEAQLAENLPQIRADNNQLHQALLNLCLNARDAIQENGKIVIQTSITNSVSFNGMERKQGEYICISVTDDGVGMEPDVLNRIYEPFFTTKSEGTGSGLGLAMVKGIVENHRGFIEVMSEIGKGTTFRLYFPV